MKKRMAAMFMSLVLASGVCTQGIGEVSFAVTTNVDIEHATSISVGSSASGTISTEGEDAYYKFTTGSENAFYTITASTSTADKSFTVDLLDADGCSVGSVDFATGEAGTMTYKLDPKTVYYLNVVMGDTEVSGKFTLKVTKVKDDYGDTMATAGSVSFNKANECAFESVADQDYLKFTTGADDNYYQVILTDKNIDGSVELEVLDEEEALIDSISADLTEPGSLTMKLEKNSTYYLHTYSGDEEMCGKYFVQVNELRDNAGDTIETAADIKYSTASVGSIEVKEDEDYFKFTTLALPAYYQLIVKNSDIADDLNVEVCDSSGSTVADLTVEQGKTETLTTEGKLDISAVYYIHVSSASGDATGSYSLSLVPLVDDGADSIETAESIPVGKSIDGKLEVALDEDFYKLNTGSENAFYEFTFSNKNLEDDLVVTILDADGQVIDSLMYSTGITEQYFVKLEPQSVYYLQFASGGDSGSGDYSYKIVALKDNAGDTMDSAIEITLGLAKAGAFETVGDEDYLKFTTLKAQSFYKISGINKNMTEELQMELLDSEGSLLASMSSERLVEDSVTLKLESNQTYYLRVYAEDACGNYSTKVTAILDDGGESFDTATALTVDKNHALALQLEEDEDYFVYTTNKITGIYKFTCKNTSKAGEEVMVVVYDSKQKELDSFSVEPGKSVSKNYKWAKNKKYYVQVSGFNTTAQYTMKLAGTYVHPKTVKLNKTSLVLKKKKKATLKINAKPAGAVVKNVKWSTSNKKIAKVSSKGIVTAVKKGSAKITCKVTFYGGKTKKLTCKVKVSN